MTPMDANECENGGSIQRFTTALPLRTGLKFRVEETA